MPYPANKAKLEQWENGLRASVSASPQAWNQYDDSIQRSLFVYNNHLRGVAGYVPPDWKKIKAMAWTETGPGFPDWNFAPMQIGVHGDPGLRELLTSPAGNLILPPEYQRVLTMGTVRSIGEFNIRAGIGYLLKILAIFKPVPDTTLDPPKHPEETAWFPPSGSSRDLYPFETRPGAHRPW